MINPVNSVQEARLFSNLVSNQNIQTEHIAQLPNMASSQKDILIKSVAENMSRTEPDVQEALATMWSKLLTGDYAEAIESIKSILPNDAAMKETPLGTAIMAKGWSKPVVFPKEGAFKWLGWADDAKAVTTEQIWEDGYGEKPALILGAVGNSNIKPEQVKGGCSLSKKELSKKYEDSIVEFYRPIIKYLQEMGASTEDIGFAFAHSDCGVDKAARQITTEHKLKGLATTPTEYTQYVKGTECPPCEEFPNGFVLADFPFPTILTRNVGQINDYATIYSKMVGKDNPIGIFGGGEHAFIHDTREALISKDGSRWVPVDIMKDLHGIVIPATNEFGAVTNAARKILDTVNGSPYEQYKYAFDAFLPSSKTKEDIKQYDPQMALTAIAYSNLARAGKIGK